MPPLANRALGPECAGWMFAAALASLALAATLILGTSGEEGAREALRGTGRVSFAWLLACFVAPAVGRRDLEGQLFAAFGTAHVVLLMIVLHLAANADHNPFDAAAIVGIAGYALLLPAFLGSFSERWAGAGFARFRQLALVGIAGVFLLFLGGNAVAGRAGAVGMLALAAVSLAVRVWRSRAS